MSEFVSFIKYRGSLLQSNNPRSMGLNVIVLKLSLYFAQFSLVERFLCE